VSERDRWGSDNYTEWGKSLSSDERAAIRDYTKDGYRDINEAARKGQITPSLRKTVDDLDAALARHPAPENIIVYRNLDLKDLNIDRASLVVGDEITDRGFTSTTLRPDLDFGGADRLEIRIAKGTPGAWLNAAGDASTAKREQEFLLPRCIDTFNIVELREDTIVVEAYSSGNPLP